MDEEMITLGQESERRWDEELRVWLKRYVADHPHHPTAVLSRAQYIGISRSALDAYLAGTYFLPKEWGGDGNDPQNSRLEPSVRAFRERVEGTSRRGYQNVFVETRAWMQVQQACNTAINENAIVVISGRPGVGKSRCLFEYAVRKMTTAPVSVLCSPNITTRYFAQRLAQELRLDDSATTSRLEDRVAEKLRRSPRPLFVDQANYLKERALGSVCYLWEVARLPVVLSGTKALHDLFTTSKLTEDVREQLASRVAIYYLLSELAPAEAKAIVQRGLRDDATDEVVAQILTITGGVHRQVDLIIPRILDLKERNRRKLADGGVTMREIVAAAGTKIMTGAL